MRYSPAVEQAATTWLSKHRATEDPRTLSLIVQRAQDLVEQFGGFISPSHFERAYLELVNEKRIGPFKGSFLEKAEKPTIPQEVVDFIARSSTFEQRRRYQTDPEFRKHYDLYEQQQRQPKQEATASLTPEQYHAMPSQELQVKLRDPKFKLQIMKLMAEGKI
jgi:hypothetical protein